MISGKCPNSLSLVSSSSGSSQGYNIEMGESWTNNEIIKILANSVFHMKMI